MRISHIHAQQVLGAYLNKVAPGKPVDPSSVSNEVPSDAVNLSPDARLVALAHQILSQMPEVRAERVTALRQQVESGQYQVDSDRVASKIVEALRARRVE
ncbi:MAG: flagellar biosynthesis anti-sigma factor FlgM [Abditibacteriales bacterium]|nr:flagellar biosynthesis anti-sigma factor FlgM [Abditibacteriales bacterium]MDW8364568.1 flagellar biosynthesis anti-sigma factor FlgM [Abditibacteriales bacterium]